MQAGQAVIKRDFHAKIVAVGMYAMVFLCVFFPCREVVPISGVCLFLSNFQVYKRYYKDILS